MDPTVRVVLSVTLPEVADIIVVPSARLWARPVVAFIVATVVFELAHITLVVISAVEASEYVPVALNC